MENTLENKTKFFAQHFGQNFIHDGEGKPIRGLGKTILMNYENSDKFQSLCFSNQRKVLLKSISKMSYSEASYMVCELGITIGYNEKDDYPSIEYYINYLDAYCDKLSANKVDLLRYNGYAVPWCGLSVEKQIEYGWIKLIE